MEVGAQRRRPGPPARARPRRRHEPRATCASSSTASTASAARCGAATPAPASGLFIVKSVVKGHRGTVSAESPGPDRGSTFTITLPGVIEEPWPPDRGGRAAPWLGSSSSRTRRTSPRASSSTSSSRATRWTWSATAREALARLPPGRRPDRYDLVILDVMLPGIDGFEVADRLRKAGNFTPDPDAHRQEPARGRRARPGGGRRRLPAQALRPARAPGPGEGPAAPARLGARRPERARDGAHRRGGGGLPELRDPRRRRRRSASRCSRPCC